MMRLFRESARELVFGLPDLPVRDRIHKCVFIISVLVSVKFTNEPLAAKVALNARGARS
jgi:hypothetical protein